MMRKLTMLVSASALAIGLAVATAAAAAPPKYTDWRAWGGSTDTMQYSSLRQITKANVGNLTEAFRIPVGGAVASPIVVGKVIYGVGDGGIFAADAGTGRVLWQNKTAAPVGRSVGMYWQSKDGKDKRIIYYTGLGFAELNATTGEKITNIGDNGVVDMREGLDRDLKYLTRPVRSGNPGRVFGDLVILGSAPGEGYGVAPGDIRAWNIVTGKMAWIFHTVIRPGEPGAETWGKDWNWKAQGAVNSWGELTLDEQNGVIYIPTGTGAPDFVTGDRMGSNLHSTSLLALDAATGKLIWEYQTVHHDMWDYDNTNGPKLLTLRIDGKRVEAIAQLGKTGYIYTLDRKTGKPIWPIPERPVPQTNVPGEMTWPTQPIPSKPEPFNTMTFTTADLPDRMTPEARDEVTRMLARARNEGVFTPPSLEGTIQMPGNHGGAQYGTSAADPVRGMLYVTTVETPALMTLVPRKSAPKVGQDQPSAPGALDAATPPAPAAPAGAAARPPALIDPSFPEDPSPWTMRNVGYKYINQNYGFIGDGMGGSAVKTMSYLVGYDMNQGKRLFRVPFGNAPASEAAGFKDTGLYQQKRTISLTASNLLFSFTNDKKFRAFDGSDGKLLFEREMTGAGNGIPAIYQVNGRQYILLAVGAPYRAGPDAPSVASAYVAYALPARR